MQNSMSKNVFFSPASQMGHSFIAVPSFFPVCVQLCCRCCSEACIYFVRQTQQGQWGCSSSTRPTWPVRRNRPWRAAWAKYLPSWAASCFKPFLVRKTQQSCLFRRRESFETLPASLYYIRFFLRCTFQIRFPVHVPIFLNVGGISFSWSLLICCTPLSHTISIRFNVGHIVWFAWLCDWL